MTTIKRILTFVYLNIVNDKFYGADYELNSTYIRSYLKSKGIYSKQFIKLVDVTLDNLIMDLTLNSSSDLVFYINEYNYYISKVVINEFKKLNEKCNIICIGPSTNYISENLSEEIMIDNYCLGCDFDILMKIASGTNYNDISMLAIKRGEQIIFNNLFKEESIIKLEEIPQPYSSGVVPVEEVMNLGLLTSKGCPGNCNFCSYIENKDLQCYSVDSIISELKFIKENLGCSGIEIKFIDDCFSLTTERTIKICEEIIKNKLMFKFWCCTRADILNELLMDKMKEANFKNIVVGLETASVPVLNKLGKVREGETANEFLTHLKNIYLYSKKINLEIIVSVNFGLSNEGIDDAYRTIDFLKENNIELVSFNYMTVFSGSRIFKDREEYSNVEFSLAPTKLPFRTLYTKFNMMQLKKGIDNSKFKNQANIPYKTYENRLNFVEFHTGISFRDKNFIASSLKYINIDSLDEKNMKFIKENLSLNGTVYNYKDKLTIKNKNSFSDNRKYIKLEIKEFDDILSLAYENDCYIENQVYISESNKIRLKYNNVFESEIDQFNSYKTNDDVIKNLYEGFSKFLNTTELTYGDLQSQIFKNSCMFSGTCTALSSPRLFIKNHKIHLCKLTKEIGSTDSTINEVFKNIRENNLKKNKLCKDCNYKEYCSKCICIDNSDAESFCKFVKCNPYIYVYINTITFIYKNLEKMNNGTKIFIYSHLNYDLDNHYLEIPKVVTILICGFQLIIYNSKTRGFYICNNEEKQLIESSIINKKSLSNNDILQKLKIKLTSRTVI